MSAAVAADSSHMTASSSASWSRFSPPSNCVNRHVQKHGQSLVTITRRRDWERSKPDDNNENMQSNTGAQTRHDNMPSMVIGVGRRVLWLSRSYGPTKYVSFIGRPCTHTYTTPQLQATSQHHSSSSSTLISSCKQHLSITHHHQQHSSPPIFSNNKLMHINNTVLCPVTTTTTIILVNLC